MWYYVVRLNAFSLRASLTAELRESSANTLVTALITNYMFTSLLESVETLDTLLGKSPYFEIEFLVRQGHHSFRNVSNVFRTGGVSKRVLQCRTAQLDGAKYLIYYTLSL